MASGDISNARHVLVADDDENDVILLRFAFQKAGLPHTLIHVRDGQETINYLSAKTSDSDNQSKPNLLLRVLMPLGFRVWMAHLPFEE